MNSISRNLMSLSKSSLLLYNFANSRIFFKPISRLPKYVLKVFDTPQNRSYTVSSESNINLENPEVQKYISSIVEEYNSLQTNENKSVTQDVRERMTELSLVVTLINERRALLADSAELKSMKDENSTDDELKGMVTEEIGTYHQKIKEIDEQILSNLVPKDPQENNGALLEVSAGVGGKEAMLFSKELFDMYCNYANFRGWELEIASMDITELGGLRHSSALISGRGPVFGLLSHEAGVHRVQRIPVTEKSGRVHTSTVRVVVLPQPTELEIEIKKEDIKVDTKRASGAGGQHVNTTDSAVRITHIATGISVECQTDRSQYRNKELALQRLRAKLYEVEKKKRDLTDAAARKEQIGEAARSEKIRTYNFNQDRITDHRISCTMHNLESFLQGKEPLDNLICNLHKKGKEERLMQVLKSTR